jgi:hypothetical protein
MAPPKSNITRFDKQHSEQYSMSNHPNSRPPDRNDDSELWISRTANCTAVLALLVTFWITGNVVNVLLLISLVLGLGVGIGRSIEIVLQTQLSAVVYFIILAFVLVVVLIFVVGILGRLL